MYIYFLSKLIFFLLYLHPAKNGKHFFYLFIWFLICFTAALLSEKVCRRSLCDAVPEHDGVRCSAYRRETISQDGSDLHQTAMSEKGREGSLSLAAAFTLSSRASWRRMWNVSIDIPMVFVASVRQPGSANHNNLFTCIQHWQWCHRMTKSVYAVCQVCAFVQACFGVCCSLFACLCVPACILMCMCVHMCVC